MEFCYLMLDVGGTAIKAGLFSGTGQMLGKVRSFRAKAKEDRQTIFRNFACVIKEMSSDTGGARIHGIGMAFPGPFDYEQGISRMRGLDKYDAIYGIRIRGGVMEQLNLIGGFSTVEENCRFLFLHDVEAFAIGAYAGAKASGCRKLMCICIGTGAGSAFVQNGRILKNPENGVPENGWIYNTPFKTGVIDDYVSVRGLKQLTEEEKIAGPSGGTVDGAGLFQMALAGDERARRVFARFGIFVEEALLPYLDLFQPDGLMFGGQIAKSFSYFGEPLSKECDIRNIRVFIEPDTSRRTMEGLYLAWMDGWDGNRKIQIRIMDKQNHGQTESWTNKIMDIQNHGRTESWTYRIMKTQNHESTRKS